MPDIASILFSGALGLIVIGLGGMLLSGHAYRVLLALVIAEAGVNLMLVIAGYRWEAVAPILTGDSVPLAMVDPVPQAMVLTAIVIGVGVQALALTVIIRVRQAYGTLNMVEIKRCMERDLDQAARPNQAGTISQGQNGVES